MTLSIQPQFAALLGEAQAAAAVADFAAALGRAAQAIARRDGDGGCAPSVHALITYAVVFGADDLAQACRAFETAVAERRDSRAARSRVAGEIGHALAALPGADGEGGRAAASRV